MFETAGAGPPLILLPGFGGRAESFERQIEAFSPRFRVLAWTMPGFAGEPALDLVSVGALSLALSRELEREGVERAHFLGHSIGGMVLLELALREPRRVASAVLFATSPSLGDSEGAFKRDFLARRLAPVEAGLSMVDLAPGLMTELVSPHADPQGVRLAIAQLAAAPPALYARLLCAAADFDRRDELEQLTMPVLCLAGEADRQAPATMMERMAQKIPRAQFALIRRAGHEAQLEQPRAFNALLSAFLADLEDDLNAGAA